MDEIIIEEKKYISSKQAAKITGYAKDYIGQLCREGRVPARLVGRNWYVLQTAIKDHRFGDPEIEPKKAIKITPQPIHPTWEAPRYEASSEEILPSINRLVAEPVESVAQNQDKELNNSQDIQGSWQAWFDRFGHTEDVVEPEIEQEPEQTEPALEENVATDIPIRVVSPSAIPAELLPRHFGIELNDQKSEEELVVHNYHERKARKGGRTIIKAVQVAGIVLAVVTFAVAVLGTGYFDKYILSNKQAQMMAGILLYNKQLK